MQVLFITLDGPAFFSTPLPNFLFTTLPNFLFTTLPTILLTTVPHLLLTFLLPYLVLVVLPYIIFTVLPFIFSIPPFIFTSGANLLAASIIFMSTAVVYFNAFFGVEINKVVLFIASIDATMLIEPLAFIKSCLPYVRVPFALLPPSVFIIFTMLL
jgi:hypothetical protein